MTWLRPWMVGALGVLATLTTAAFFVAGALSFAPEQIEWGAPFRKYAIVFGYVPFALWAIYMYTRVRLGAALNARGAFGAALKYTSARVVHSFWLRSRREVLIHRLAMGEAALALGDYLRADEALVFGDEVLPRSFREQLRLSWLRMELHLRMDNLLAARQAFEQYERHRSPAPDRAHQLAARVEVACRMKDEDRARAWLEQAEWRDADHYRVHLSRALLHARFSTRPADLQSALDALDAAQDAANRAIPRRAPELHLLRADLLERLDRHDEAAQAVEAARQLIDADQADERAQHIWRDWQRAHPTTTSEEE